MNGRGRILGSETEWAMLIMENGRPKPNDFVDTAPGTMHILFESIPSPPRLPSSATGQSDFYGNGSRIYIDTGNHCEYATGEVMGETEGVAHEKAGERIIESAVANANEHPYFKENGLMLRSFKNNKDIMGNTYGAHDNYCMLREKIRGKSGIYETMLHLLAPFRISSKLFAGNGWLKEENGRLTYHLSQRAEELIKIISGSTTSSRGLIHTRDEPHADQERFYRLHLIDGDALLAEPALFLKFGTTLLVLDMIESGFLTGRPFGNGDDFINALHAFSADATLRATPNINGKTYTIINIQEEYLKWANRFCEISGCTPERRRTLQWWEKIITLSKTPEPDIALAPFVDRAAKKVVMDKKLEKLGYDWSTPSATELPKKIISRAADEEEVILLPEQIAARDKKNPPTLFCVLKSIDFQFHENSPEGLARILGKRGFLERIISDKDIEYAIANPSPNTRALPRTFWNKKLLAKVKNPEKIEVNWKYIKYPTEKIIWFPDPYNTGLKF